MFLLKDISSLMGRLEFLQTLFGKTSIVNHIQQPAKCIERVNAILCQKQTKQQILN